MMKGTLASGFASASSSSGNGLVRRISSVRSSAALPAFHGGGEELPEGSRFDQRAKLAAQSRARTGSPSWNRSPSRRRMRHTRPSSETVWPSAICGRGLSCPSTA